MRSVKQIIHVLSLISMMIMCEAREVTLRNRQMKNYEKRLIRKLKGSKSMKAPKSKSVKSTKVPSLKSTKAPKSPPSLKSTKAPKSSSDKGGHDDLDMDATLTSLTVESGTQVKMMSPYLFLVVSTVATFMFM
ncbi:predicted protein [Chaetoceros tenuissimus]|uniref:Uncharacterized protein n=1 Tax=Chaetoceros tenuissimus TaxID=426638 RepID=A0AAD3H188_9STRA|nr:predicted protein [Chaetoceros tenuissimus]